MKRREKPYSLEEDLVLDTRHEGLTDAEWRYKIALLEQYDPGGKKARAITLRMMYEPLTTA
jgi:hypothetical protein